MSEKIIAERHLCYSLKGKSDKIPFVIRISEPYLLDKNRVDFPIEEGFAGCDVLVIGVDEGLHSDNVYGADSLQALHLASNVEPILERLQKKYDIFFTDGEPYFG